MTDVVELLGWRAPSTAPQRQRVALLAAVGNDLGVALTDAGDRFACATRAAAARRALDDADGLTLLRILGAPEVCRAATHYHAAPSLELLDELEGWFEAETALAAGAPALAAPRWSALGDELVPGTDDAPDEWGLHGRRRAPLARDGIVIDFDSPAARRTPKCNEHRPIKMQAPVPMTADERRATIDKLEAALAALAEACPPAYAFVATQTRVIQPRKDGVHPDFYTSASIRTTIGRTALNNPHRDKVGVPAIVSSLVHEAIHAYLYTEERAHPIATDLDRAFDAYAISPWTGSTLALPTYLHACFVWHGLRTLWRLPALARTFGDAAAAEQLALAEAGFARDLAEPIRGLRALVAPWVWSSIERMSDVH